MNLPAFFDTEIRTGRDLASFVVRISLAATVTSLVLSTAISMVWWLGWEVYWFFFVQTAVIAPIVASPMIYMVGRTGRQLVEAHDELLRLSRTDGLTDLPNRRAFMAEVEALGDGPMALAIADIDHFKAVNDVHGHAAGDLVIREVADRLRATAGRHRIARMGGEEFVAVVATEDESALFEWMEEFRLAVSREPVVTPTGLIPVTVSIGIAVRQGRNFDQLYAAADAALYAAKSSGRNRTVAESGTCEIDADEIMWRADGDADHVAAGERASAGRDVDREPAEARLLVF